jgi:hypothetical protein
MSFYVKCDLNDYVFFALGQFIPHSILVKWRFVAILIKSIPMKPIKTPLPIALIVASRYCWQQTCLSRESAASENETEKRIAILNLEAPAC